MKRIAVLIPVYNCEQFVAESIQSVLDQTYQEFTVFVVDDCSSDETIAAVKALNDPRIQLIARDQNSGIVDTLNRGLDAIGEEFDYIARMDGDDICLPQRFERQVQFLDAHPEVGVVSCYYELFDQQQGIAKADTEADLIQAFLLFNSPVCHPAAMIRASVLREHALRYRNNYKHHEDYDLWMRLVPHAQIAVIPEVMLRYRISGQNVTIRKKEEKDEVAFRFHREITLSQLDLEPSREELYFHTNRWEYLTDMNEKTVRAYRSWLDRILKQNATKQVFPQAALETIVERYWNKFFYKLADNYPSLLKAYWSAKPNPNKSAQKKYALKGKINRLLKRN